ncbi:MAG TPA: 2-keto-4-pentenoate hydratase [Caulobacterales bacterium]|nr:2-keto-4-pentenoate hydratase [Caulobacterales bacterium]
MAGAYAVQDIAISLWPEAVAGWKIGLVPLAARNAFQAERIAGPIFAGAVQADANGGPFEFPVFSGGFAAVEAELVFHVGADAPAGRVEWSKDEIIPFIDAVHIGVECAGSPFAAINDSGPAVTASDFGNNAGLLIGAEVRDWQAMDLGAVEVVTKINDAVAGRGSAASIPGGPFAALAFIFEHTARRGRPLRQGQWISTGALTGVHAVQADDAAQAEFGPLGVIACRAAVFSPDRDPPVRA